MVNGYRLFLLLFLCCSIQVSAQWGGGEKYPELKPHESSMELFEEMRFGIFVHWGPSTLRGTSSWGRGNHPYDFAPKVPINEFDSLYLQFNPVLFDADEWISTVKASGAKYFVITSKHHDGFCIFDSEYTSYDIGSTPYGKDVMMDLARACRNQEIKFGTYYSICDWHHPDYPGRYGGDPRPVSQSDMKKYRQYLYNQMDELVDHYGSEIMWFDGSWESPWTHEDGMDLYYYLRNKKDDLIINNRVDKKQNLKQRPDLTGKYAGDFKTPEQEIGAYDNDLPWESCITITDRGWHFNPQSRVKTLNELIHTLVQTAGGGGNLLLNISPMPDGRIEMFQRNRLLALGNWLQRYGASIYGTDGGPFHPNEYFTATRSGNKIYIHILDWPEDVLLIPKFKEKIRDKYLFDGGEFLLTDQSDYWELKVNKESRHPDNTIFVFELDEETQGIEDLPEITFKNQRKALLLAQPSEKYAGLGSKTLVNSKPGTISDYYNEWIGYEGESLEAIIDLSTLTEVNGITVGCLLSQADWIFLPQKIEVFTSTNGKEFQKAHEENYRTVPNNEKKRAELTVSFAPREARYVKVILESLINCPDWHKGSGGKAWLFVDEIQCLSSSGN